MSPTPTSVSILLIVAAVAIAIFGNPAACVGAAAIVTAFRPRRQP